MLHKYQTSTFSQACNSLADWLATQLARFDYRVCWLAKGQSAVRLRSAVFRQYCFPGMDMRSTGHKGSILAQISQKTTKLHAYRVAFTTMCFSGPTPLIRSDLLLVHKPFARLLRQCLHRHAHGVLRPVLGHDRDRDRHPNPIPSQWVSDLIGKSWVRITFSYNKTGALLMKSLEKKEIKNYTAAL